MFDINQYDEVYGVFDRKSVRGCIISRFDEEVNCVFENGYAGTFCYGDFGKKIFATEKELIKKCGSNIVEFAAPKKLFIDQANDFYNMPVKVDDYVVAIAGNPLYCKVEGKIERIYKEYSEYHPERIYVDLRKSSDQTFTRVEVSDLCLQSRFA